MDIAKILQNLDIIEGKTSPVSMQHGLTPQQQKSHQLPALFRPKKIAVLTAKTDPAHPTKGYFVGDSVEPDVAQTPLEETMRSVEEDMISKTRADLKQYLDMISNEKKDSNFTPRQSTKQADVVEDPTESDPTPDQPLKTMMSSSGSIPVKTIALEDGDVLEIHGNVKDGFNIGHKGQISSRSVPTIEDATKLIDLYRQKLKANSSADYVEER
jgi:hypothetical protein